MKSYKKKENPKIKEKSARRKCRSRSKHKLFSETFIYDPSNVFSKPMQKSEIRSRVEIPKGTKIMRKNILKLKKNNNSSIEVITPIVSR